MILGKIVGKSSTKQFTFQVIGDARKFEYVQVMHSSGFFVLAQIEEIEKDPEKTLAFCNILGYRDETHDLQRLSFPLDPGVEVLRADDDFIRDVLGLEKKKNAAYIGFLDGRDSLKVYLDLDTVLSKHVSVLAKSGSGKSYCTGVLLEELLMKKVPIVVIDPHGEYASLKYPNPKDKESLIRFGVHAKGFLTQILEFSPNTSLNPEAKPLKLSNRGITSEELVHLLPTKLSSSQLGIVYAALKNLGEKVDFDDLLFELEAAEESSTKWTLIHIFQYVKSLNLFSNTPTLMSDLVSPGKMSIITLKGVEQDVQEIVVYKIIHDLFMERKKNMIAPFFLVIEECHNFVPERNFGEAKSSAIIRQIAAEGRKFGMGLCLISQRPSRVEKSALSQTSTQFILKVTNPNDVKAISNSVEGITWNTEKELQNLPIGMALVTGVVDLPLLVDIRPRMSKHGGEAVSAFADDDEGQRETKGETVEESEALPLIKQKFTLEDIKLMHGTTARITEELVPCVLLRCRKDDEEFSLLIDLVALHVIENLEEVSGQSLVALNLQPLTPKQEKVLATAVRMGQFKAADLFGKSGLQFSEFYDAVHGLVKKGYVTQQNSEYRLSPALEFLAALQKKQFYQQITYARSHAQKVEAKYQVSSVTEFLKTFVEVTSAKECFIEKYSVSKINTLS